MALELAGHVHVEQVDLVVARDLATRVVEDEARRRNARLVGQLERDRAADDPEAVHARLLGEERLDRAGAVSFGNRELVGFATPHEREILRQHGDHRALRPGLPEQFAGDSEIARHVGAGSHLDGGDMRHGEFSPCFSTVPAAAPTPAGAEIRCTTGAAQEPVTW